VVFGLAVAALALSRPAEVCGQGGGVFVDAEGVLHMRFFRDPTGALTRRRLAEAKAALPRELAHPSKLRKISLNRLEAALARSVDRGEGIPDDMKYLAGLTRIQYVFYYPETKDIVIAGPAEGYMRNLAGRAVGVTTGQAVLELEDLVTALRTFSPDGKRASVVSVSIDPTKEGLAAMQAYLRRVGGRATPRNTKALVDGMRESLGLQTVTIKGVSPKSHFAQVLVEADYRMKLIGIALEPNQAKITPYVHRAKPAAIARNAMKRWYFVPNYECVRVSGDELAMELVGDGVKLIGRDELVTMTGGRVGTKTVDPANEAFTGEFTRKYPKLAATTPVYAQMRNLIDMAIAAAYIQDRDLYAKAGWRMPILGDEKAFPIETYTAPKQVPTAVNAIWRGRTLMTPIGGGVRIEARKALESDRLLKDEGGKLGDAHDKIDLGGLDAGKWWWD